MNADLLSKEHVTLNEVKGLGVTLSEILRCAQNDGLLNQNDGLLNQNDGLLKWIV